MKRICALVLALLMPAALAGCGSNAAKDVENYTLSEDYYASPMEEAAAKGWDSGYEEEYYEPESYYEEDSYAVGSGSTASSTANDSGNTADVAAADFDDSKIIYSCNAEIETRDFDACCAAVQTMIDQVGGFLESGTVYGEGYWANDSRAADYCIRIPRGKFDSVTQNLSSFGSVIYLNTYAENVGSEYHDTESRLAVYRTEEERLLAMLEKAETVEDMLNIEDRLADVRYNIESLTTQIGAWDSLIRYSTLNLTIQEVEEYTVEPELGYWQQIGADFVDTLKGVGNFFAQFLAVLIAALPVLAVLAAIVFVIILLIRRHRRRRAARRAEKAAEALAQAASEAEKKE